MNISADDVSSVPSSMPDKGPDPQKFMNYSKQWEFMFMFDDKALKKLKNPPPPAPLPTVKDLQIKIEGDTPDGKAEIPEEEKLNEIKSGMGGENGPSPIHNNPSFSHDDPTGISPNVSMLQKPPAKEGDQSLQIVADISDIIADTTTALTNGGQKV